MDSFEMYGELMNQYDSLLPPGEIRKKILDTALMGLESKGGGGGDSGSSGPDWDEVADLQHEQAMNSYNYDWDNTQRQYNHMLLQNEIQKQDQLTQHTYQTAQQEQQWMYANAQKEQQYNANMAAFNKSEKMYGWQVDMNQISADMARDEQLAQTNERYQALAFEAQEASLNYHFDTRGTGLKYQFETQAAGLKYGFDTREAGLKYRSDLTESILKNTEAALQYGAKKTDLSLQGMGVDLDISSKRTAGQRQKQSLTIDQQTKRGQAAAQSVEDTVKGMQAAGQVEAKGQAGGSAAKQYQSMVAQSSRLQAAKAFELNRSDLATRLALNGVDQTLAEQEAGATLSQAKIGAAGLTADAGYEITKSSLKNAENYMKDMYSLGNEQRSEMYSLGNEQRSEMYILGNEQRSEMYNLGAEQRDATSLSIGSAHDRANKKIAHDQYAANVQADFNRMSQPTMGIPIPKPLEIPMATIMDPIVPVRGEEPVWGAGGGGGVSSAGSTGGGGVISSAMTGAGSLAMSAGAIPGLLPAASAIPGIGLGIAAVGIIGGAAGWF